MPCINEETDTSCVTYEGPLTVNVDLVKEAYDPKNVVPIFLTIIQIFCLSQSKSCASLCHPQSILSKRTHFWCCCPLLDWGDKPTAYINNLKVVQVINFQLIMYAYKSASSVNNFSGFNQYKAMGMKCLAQRHNTAPLGRIELAIKSLTLSQPSYRCSLVSKYIYNGNTMPRTATEFRYPKIHCFYGFNVT